VLVGIIIIIIIIVILSSCRRETATIYPRPCTLHAAAQLQPINALRLACGAQRALLPVAVGSMNIHDVRDRRRQTSDVRHQTASLLNAPA